MCNIPRHRQDLLFLFVITVDKFSYNLKLLRSQLPQAISKADLMLIVNSPKVTVGHLSSFTFLTFYRKDLWTHKIYKCYFNFQEHHDRHTNTLSAILHIS